MAEITVKFTQAEWGMPVDRMSSAYQELVKLRAEGKSWKFVTQETGIGYASGWLAEQRCKLPTDQLIPVDPADVPALCAAVRHARLVEGNSWGRIMVRTGLPEGAVSRAFELATNVQRAGLRNGKGGRFLHDNAEAYAPAPKVGWVRKTSADAALPEEIRVGLIQAGALPADLDELEGMTTKALKAFAQALDLASSGKKDVLIARIASAMA